MSNDICMNCKHYFPQDNNGGDRGVCKLNPPQPFPVQTIEALTNQPQMQIIAMPVSVNSADWCGQFVGVRVLKSAK